MLRYSRMNIFPLKTHFFALAMILCALACAAPPAYAQEASPDGAAPLRFEGRVKAIDSTTIIIGRDRLRLWGIENVQGMGVSFNLQARAALDNVAGRSAAACEMKERKGDTIYAQCVNERDEDIGLSLLQKGYATVDRGAVFGTVFEEAYIQGEMKAQAAGAGVWGAQRDGLGRNASGIIAFAAVLFLLVFGAFAVLAFLIMRGFRKVIDAQKQSLELLSRHRKLREKERAVVAVMLDTEMKGNKAKIEAYRAVYEEMLAALKDPDKPKKYRKSGDIIQKQPALSRAVFDRNTDKLEMLGDRLSSQIVHFYARVKSVPDYINLEAGATTGEAVALIESALKNAAQMNKIIDGILESLANIGVRSENFADEILP